MILADDILYSIYYSNKYRDTLLTSLLTAENQGEDTCVLENKYIVLGEWIRILKNYYATAFDESGDSVTPDFVCLTQEQAIQLVAKLRLARGNNTYPAPTIFELGIWLDSAGSWNDSFLWYDNINIS